MTFKHVKFEDSPIMRSLEKVAKEKGLIKNDPISKTASAAKTLDLIPTNDFMSNLFKLCEGLRSQNLHKYANELENNFLNYKRAQTLYETSPEKGEDLIGAAHPKGSHKLEDLDSDEATVEDILDQHLKIIEVVNKKPSGKLSTASGINAVKKVLGQSTLSPEQIANLYKTQIMEKMRSTLSVARDGLEIARRAQSSGYLDESDYSDIAEALQRAINSWQRMRTDAGPSAAGVTGMLQNYKAAVSSCNDINNEDIKHAAIVKFNEAIGNLEPLLTTIQQYNSNPNVLPFGISIPVVQTSTQLKDVYKEQLSNLTARLNFYINSHAENKMPNPNNRQKALKFLDDIKKSLESMLSQITSNTESQLQSIKEDIDSQITKLTNSLKWYKANVIDKTPVGQ